MNILDLLELIKEQYLLNEDKKTHKKYSKNITTSYLKDTNKTKQDYHFSLIKKSIKKEKNLTTKEKHKLLNQLEKTKGRIEREEQENQAKLEKSNNTNNSVENLMSKMADTFDQISNKNKKQREESDPNETILSNIKNFFYDLIDEYKNWKEKYNDNQGDFKSFLEKLRSYNNKPINAEGGNGIKKLSVDISEEFVKMIK